MQEGSLEKATQKATPLKQNVSVKLRRFISSLQSNERHE